MLTSAAIDEAASAPDFGQDIVLGSTANRIMVNLSGVCGTTSCDTIDDNVFVNVVTAPVPEPGTWATILLGFGLVGYALRRRSRITARVSNATC